MSCFMSFAFRTQDGLGVPAFLMLHVVHSPESWGHCGAVVSETQSRLLSRTMDVKHTAKPQNLSRESPPLPELKTGLFQGRVKAYLSHHF